VISEKLPVPAQPLDIPRSSELMTVTVTNTSHRRRRPGLDHPKTDDKIKHATGQGEDADIPESSSPGRTDHPDEGCQGWRHRSNTQIGIL